MDLTAYKNIPAVVLWTGGKDCAMALKKTQQAGVDVKGLVTFAPKNPQFKAHPIAHMHQQAQQLNLPHQILTVPSPYDKSYENNLLQLKQQGIQAVITGDIDLVNGEPNWMQARCNAVDMFCLRPLWQVNRLQHMQAIINSGLKVKISYINSPLIPQAWVGRCIDEALLAELTCLQAQYGIDICGEQGEYHTMVEF